MPFRTALLTLALLLALAAPAAAQDSGGSCLTTEPPPPAEVEKLRFGINARLAGSAGATQQEPVAEDPRQRTEALTDLRPKRRR